jgi:AmmeMemoRadiSam system protein B/AmmeMemoRadiSam system protein A
MGLWWKPSHAQFNLEGSRKTRYAGSWYEGDGTKLKTQLIDMLAKAQPLIDPKSAMKLSAQNHNLTQPVLAIIAPHAGYAYSGMAAAHSYKSLGSQKVKRVILLGPSHHVAFRGVVLPASPIYDTPLGPLQVDMTMVNDLKEYPMFAIAPDVQNVEHSLELQLPFIKQVFGNPEIVPLVIGTLSDEAEIRSLAGTLKQRLRPGDLVVVSSDFTHFGERYDYVPFKDNTKENVRKLDARAFSYIEHEDLEGFLKFQHDTGDTICGFYPCCLLLAMLPSDTKVTLLQYYTSQDVVKEHDENSVSYMSIAFTGGNWGDQKPVAQASQASNVLLAKSEEQSLLHLARTTLTEYVKTGKRPNIQQLGFTPSKIMQERFGVFVTLYTVGHKAGSSQGHLAQSTKELRGCIGNIWPVRRLYEGVIENTINACSNDYRFKPVKADELNNLKIEINVLTVPRPIGSYKDIVLGRDGIVLIKERHQAVFLPHVATEQGWTLEQTLTELSQKAGLMPSDWKEGAKFEVFQSSVFEE